MKVPATPLPTMMTMAVMKAAAVLRTRTATAKMMAAEKRMFGRLRYR
jgi:hypothetical protein